MAATDIPGTARTVAFDVAGGHFVYRLPSRADLAETQRRFAAKVSPTGIAAESDILLAYDGNPLLWEARLEVGLVPYVRRDGTPATLGEDAPAHWFEQLPPRDGQTPERRISFANVMPEEFDVVVAYLAVHVLPKKKLTETPPISTGPASEPTAG